MDLKKNDFNSCLNLETEWLFLTDIGNLFHGRTTLGEKKNTWMCQF